MTRRNPTQKIGQARPTDDRPRGQRAPAHERRKIARLQSELDEARIEHAELTGRMAKLYTRGGIAAGLAAIDLWNVLFEGSPASLLIVAAAFFGLGFWWLHDGYRAEKRADEIVEGLTTLS